MFNSLMKFSFFLYHLSHSGPVQFCFDMTDPSNDTQLNYTCTMAEETSEGMFSVWLDHKLSKAGIYTIQLVATNVVSVGEHTLRVGVEKPPGL